ncbi:G2/mitotic-specific cyclin-A-like [Gordionus sp. m RMFG-2023]|uniref:G2/mitotic-specific cyclin-A-like n=1 Tax=Gordionus sp. m RMFG-2023 TaxID=3053472 RepID=UPI0031FC9DCF
MSKAKNAEIQQDLYNNATNKLDNEIYNHQKNVQSLKIDTSPVFKKSSQHNILRSSEGKACKSLKFLPQEKSHLFSPIKYQKADNNPIPKLNWADNHNLWKLLKESENRLESKANLLNNHPDLNNHMLQVLFDWLSEVCGVMNLKRVTYHLTLHLA